jgi:protein-disulfide isomerase
MRITFAHLALVIGSLFLTETCRAQTPAKGLTPEQSWRIERFFRSEVALPPEADVHVRLIGPSSIPNFNRIVITYNTLEKSGQEVDLLLSDDTRKVAQYREFDIAPSTLGQVEDGGRPSRGGPLNAPVTLVVFDDLECPFCARLNSYLYPSIQKRYGNRVRIVYRNFPLEGHPWARHAAMAVDCLSSHPNAYWAAIDQIHNFASTIGGAERSIGKADADINTIILREAQPFNDSNAVASCISKNDQTEVNQSVRYGDGLGVSSTPTIFINGAKIEGAVSTDFLFKIIDEALLVKGASIVPGQ